MSGQDFTAFWTMGITWTTWEDPARPAGTGGVDDPGAPSRLNPHVGRPALRAIGTVGTPIQGMAKVGDSLGPVDGELSGRLFTAWLAERPGNGCPAVTGAPDQSSIQSFTPMDAGHHTLALARRAGGTIFLHVDVEDA